MEKYICIHGHFYQPPRENPWLEDVEIQDSAHPFHDWNERITAECYAPNASSRILGPRERILDIVNNYARISFNFGPTLLSWMAQHKPDDYRLILESDRLSQERFSGHGSALAQVYNHMIMPLANSRDKETQIVWGIRDFEHRFGRKPEGMWLAETAVDLETLDLLAAHGIKFTLLASHQAARVRKIRETKWKDVSGSKVDPRMPYRCMLPSNRSIYLFFYDNPIAHDVAFGGLLNNGELFAQRLMSTFSENGADPGQAAQLVHIATDGETYGHHHRYGDMALAYCLFTLESQKLATLTNYGEFLDKFAVLYEAEIFENSSWSCFHGVERWRSNCGCNCSRIPGGSQAWRGPLREAMDYIRDSLAPRFEQAMAKYVRDPWAARNDYIDVILDRSDAGLERFFSRHAHRTLNSEERVLVLKLMEMQRNAMLMYTSCGWFFDEISGIETLQVMQYAARAMQLAGETLNLSLESGYQEILKQAASNLPEFFNGEQVWKEYVQPTVIDIGKVCAHYAASSLFEDFPEELKMYCFTIRQEAYTREIRGEKKLAVGRVVIRSEITREERDMSFAVLQHEDYNLTGGVRPVNEDDHWLRQHQDILSVFRQGDLERAVQLVGRHYPSPDFSLWLLYKDEQMKVLHFLLDSSVRESDRYFRGVYQRHYPLIQVMNKMHVPLPKLLATTVEYVLNADMTKLLDEEPLDLNRLWKLGTEMKKWSFKRDKGPLGYKASQKILSLMEQLKVSPLALEPLRTLAELMEIFWSLPLELDIWKAQNLYYYINTQHYDSQMAKAQKDLQVKEWVDLFERLGQSLRLAR